ncbi:MAG: cation-translocating P-type ATPase [Isosphaeraceae bacterium]
MDDTAARDSSATAVSEAHARSVADVAEALAVNPRDGLDDDQVALRRERYGLNRLAEAEPTSAWRRFLAQFQELVILILVAAAVVSGALGEWADTLAILAIVILNGLLGFFQEERAGRALAALRSLSTPSARVVRSKTLRVVPAPELVPGDVIELEAGDSVPADARLIRAFGLHVQEAALTGESLPVGKDPEAKLAATDPLGDRSTMVYLGTVVASGKGRAVVTATGMATELGRIAGLLVRSEPEPTPLQRRLTGLGKTLVGVCLSAVALIFVIQTLRGDRLVEAFLLAVSLAVAAVPEGLPAVVTMALAIGLQRMVRRNALVRKLPSVETLGSVTVICSDKTGTLTRNEMTVREIVVPDATYHVSGAGYAPHGTFSKPSGAERTESAAVDPRHEPGLMRALRVAAWCHNAQITPRGDGSGSWQVIGDPTEGALVVAALKAELEAVDPDERVVLEIPFDTERRAMSVVVREADGSALMFTKGAPETVLARCVSEFRGGQVVPLTDERRAEIAAVNAAMASRALRVLALSDRSFPDASVGRFDEVDLTFVGLAGMIDPPRDEARDAVQTCRDAGIRPVMITGDHPETALAIARELGLVEADANLAASAVMTGPALEAIPDETLRETVATTSVYARVSAEHKLRVVRAWKARGEIVAMTGDGVNDAPAIEAADIGIAMGIAGTDVTREASDMVLTDDNFASIVSAVEEGRGIFDNIQKFVLYLLACNAGEVLVMLFAVVVGWPAPLTALQILWINLVTDGLPALALGLEPPEPDIMNRPPRPPGEPVISRRRGLMILGHGLLVATVTCIGFALVRRNSGLEQARTAALSVLAFAQLFYSFSCRSQRYTLPQLGVFTNPYLLGAIATSALLQVSITTWPVARSVFNVMAHEPQEWLLVLGLALTPVTLIELGKLVRSALRPAISAEPAWTGSAWATPAGCPRLVDRIPPRGVTSR